MSLILRRKPILKRVWSHLESLLKYRFLGPTFRISDSGDLGSGLRICFSNKISGDCDTAGCVWVVGGKRPYFENHC